MERRTSKRQRTSASHRFEPGEGGGLDSKKPKANNGVGAAWPGNLSKDAGQTQTITGLTRGMGDTQKTIVEKFFREKRGNDGAMQDSIPREWSEPLYRWTDEGIKNDATPSSVEHEGVEIDFINSKSAHWTPPLPFTVRIGDAVLISSGITPWDDTNSANARTCDVVPIYNDPSSREAGVAALDPFIGYVERLWEDVEDPLKKGNGQRKKKGKSTKSTKASKMMTRIRWFFKKEDLEELDGSFAAEGVMNVGNSKEKILATMASRDLALTDRSDDNVISTILGKVQVIRRKPLDSSEEDVEMTHPKGTLVCRYDLSICTDKSSGKKGMVRLFPCRDGTEYCSSTKRNGSKDIDPVDPISTDDDADASAKQCGINNYTAPFSPLTFPLSPGRVVSEGATNVGRIKIGPHHQAIIPPQLDLERKTSLRDMAHPLSQRIPDMVWDPATDEDGAVDWFLEETCLLLSNYMKRIELQPFHDTPYESPDTKEEAKKPREVNIDYLLTELHECKGDVRRAMNKISSSPEKYMSIWNKEDKMQFETGYRAYRESIRMITKSLGSSKSCKDTVDYQYRFKLVENFRRFKMKKHKKAEEIMSNVEDRMLNEKMKEAKIQEPIETDMSSLEEEEGKIPAIINNKAESALAGVLATRVGPVNNRVRTWFRTGGGVEGVVGATQIRRNHACDVLSKIRETVGNDAYVRLAKSLKACISSQTTDKLLPDVRTTATGVLKSHPDLLAQFMIFLPHNVRSN